jgi:hypothetical protein
MCLGVFNVMKTTVLEQWKLQITRQRSSLVRCQTETDCASPSDSTANRSVRREGEWAMTEPNDSTCY